jgi:hypothetical protein
MVFEACKWQSTCGPSNKKLFLRESPSAHLESMSYGLLVLMSVGLFSTKKGKEERRKKDAPIEWQQQQQQQQPHKQRERDIYITDAAEETAGFS